MENERWEEDIETRQYLKELDRNRDINEKMRCLAMSYRLENQYKKPSKEEELHIRIKNLECQVSLLLNPPPVVSEDILYVR